MNVLDPFSIFNKKDDYSDINTRTEMTKQPIFPPQQRENRLIVLRLALWNRD